MSLIIDKIKKKAIIAKLASPVIIGGATLLNNPAGVAKGALSIGKDLFGANFSGAFTGANALSKSIFNPGGAAGIAVNSALAITSVLDFGIGAAEIYNGIKSRSKYLIGMGVADIAISSVGPLLMTGFGISAVGVALAASVAKVALAFSKYKNKTTSHIQQADSIFSVVGYGASTAIKAGVATLPATALSILNTISQVLFMRSKYAVCSSEPAPKNS